MQVFPFRLKGRLLLAEQAVPLDYSPRPIPPTITVRHPVTKTTPSSTNLSLTSSHNFRTIPKSNSRSRLSPSVSSSHIDPPLPRSNSSLVHSFKQVRLVFTGTSKSSNGRVFGGGTTAREGGGEETREAFVFPPAANRWVIFEDELSGLSLLGSSNKAWEVFEVCLLFCLSPFQSLITHTGSFEDRRRMGKR